MHKIKPIFSSERMLHKDYDRRDSVGKKEKISVLEAQRSWREDELIGDKLPVITRDPSAKCLFC
jgi:hypothetical protein